MSPQLTRLLITGIIEAIDLATRAAKRTGSNPSAGCILAHAELTTALADVDESESLVEALSPDPSVQEGTNASSLEDTTDTAGFTPTDE